MTAGAAAEEDRRRGDFLLRPAYPGKQLHQRAPGRPVRSGAASLRARIPAPSLVTVGQNDHPGVGGDRPRCCPPHRPISLASLTAAVGAPAAESCQAAVSRVATSLLTSTKQQGRLLTQTVRSVRTSMRGPTPGDLLAGRPERAVACMVDGAMSQVDGILQRRRAGTGSDIALL